MWDIFGLLTFIEVALDEDKDTKNVDGWTKIYGRGASIVLTIVLVT